MRLLALVWNSQIVSLAALFAAIVWMLRNQKDKVRPLLVFALLLNLFFGLLLNVGMSEENSLFPAKYDLILFHLDTALGVTATSLSNHLQGRLALPLNIVYQLMVPLMIVWIPATGYRTPRGSVVLAYITELVAGPLSYAVVPACGPAYALGARWLHPPTVDVKTIQLAGLPNAFPSLHIATALVLVLFAKGPVWRTIGLIFLVATGMAVLSTGEHYLIDLFPGLAFGCFAGAVGYLQFRRAGAYLGLVMMWLLTVRFGYGFLIAHRAFLRLLAVGTAAVVIATVVEQWRPATRREAGELHQALSVAE